MDAADKVLMVAQQKIKETMTELEQANSAVDQGWPSDKVAAGRHDAAGTVEAATRDGRCCENGKRRKS